MSHTLHIDRPRHRHRQPPDVRPERDSDAFRDGPGVRLSATAAIAASDLRAGSYVTRTVFERGSTDASMIPSTSRRLSATRRAFQGQFMLDTGSSVVRSSSLAPEFASSLFRVITLRCMHGDDIPISRNAPTLRLEPSKGESRNVPIGFVYNRMGQRNQVRSRMLNTT